MPRGGIRGGVPATLRPATGEAMTLMEVAPEFRYSTSIRIGNFMDYFNGIYKFKYCDLGQEWVKSGPLA